MSAAVVTLTTSERGYRWPLPVAILADAASAHRVAGPTFDRGVADALASLMRSWDADDARVWLESLATMLTLPHRAASPTTAALLPLTRAALASLA